MKTATKTKPKKSVKASSKKAFHIGMIAPLTESNNAELFCRAIEGASELGFHVSILAEGDQKSQEFCFEMLERYPENFSVLESSINNRSEIIQTSDIIVFAGAPEKKLFNEVLAENVPMVLPEGCGITDFNPQKESGEGFTFRKGSFWNMMGSIIRASENKKFSYDWKNLKKNLAKV